MRTTFYVLILTLIVGCTKEPDIYTIKRGDSLSKISQQHNTRLKDLIRWNDLSQDDKIFAGQKLKIYNSSRSYTPFIQRNGGNKLIKRIVGVWTADTGESIFLKKGKGDIFIFDYADDPRFLNKNGMTQVYLVDPAKHWIEDVPKGFFLMMDRGCPLSDFVYDPDEDVIIYPELGTIFRRR